MSRLGLVMSHFEMAGLIELVGNQLPSKYCLKEEFLVRKKLWTKVCLRRLLTLTNLTKK